MDLLILTRIQQVIKYNRTKNTEFRFLKIEMNKHIQFLKKKPVV